MIRPELYLADEVFMTGTAAHVTPLLEVEGAEGLELQATLDGAEAAALRRANTARSVAARSALPQLALLELRLVSAQEEERRAISRELHDEVGQSLSALLMETNGIPIGFNIITGALYEKDKAMVYHKIMGGK